MRVLRAGFHHIIGDRVEAVDPQDVLDLNEQPVEQPEVATRVRTMVATACASVKSASSIASPKVGDASAFYSIMLNGYPIGDRVSDEDAVHLDALLLRHDEESEKRGAGIA